MSPYLAAFLNVTHDSQIELSSTQCCMTSFFGGQFPVWNSLYFSEKENQMSNKSTQTMKVWPLHALS